MREKVWKGISLSLYEKNSSQIKKSRKNTKKYLFVWNLSTVHFGNNKETYYYISKRSTDFFLNEHAKFETFDLKTNRDTGMYRLLV
jgi:hypothetical protein